MNFYNPHSMTDDFGIGSSQRSTPHTLADAIDLASDPD